VLWLAGCGSSAPRVPDVSRLPLVDGTSIVARARQCDRGASAYCAIELVVVDPRFANSEELRKAERDRLVASGWSRASGDTGNEHAADSPGHRLRVTYATAQADLQGIDLGWIQRSRSVTLALSRALFARTAALSMMLELGSS
jgi:hypothetical protein